MIVDNLLFHNVAEMLDSENGKIMLRIPNNVSNHLSDKGKNANLSNCGVEIRFVMPNSGCVKIKLKYEPSLATHTIATEGTIDKEQEVGKTYTQAIVSYGGFAVKSLNIPTEETEFVFELPEDEDMKNRFNALCTLGKEYGYPFDTRCVRIMFKEARGVLYCGAEGNIITPTSDMMPNKEILIYGSSLTHGSLGLTPLNTYANLTAESLKCDLINLGLAGSCLAEKEIIDYIAKQNFDIALIELGANMLNSFTLDEFKERVCYSVKKITEENKNKKIFFLSPFYQYMDLTQKDKIDSYRKIMEDSVNAFSNAVYLDGSKMMPDLTALSSDLVHLSVKGTKIAAKNIADAIKKEVSL